MSAHPGPEAPAGESRTHAGNRRTVKGTLRAQQILEVAERMFHRQGYAQTSMEDIARETGLLKGSLYYYVKSKDDLLFRVVDDVHTVAQTQLDGARLRADLPPLGRLLLFVESQVRYNATHVTRVAVYHHEWRSLDTERRRGVRAKRREYDLGLIELIEEARDAGEISNAGDSRLAAMSVLAVICWPYTWYREGSVAPEELASYCSTFVRAALGGPLAFERDARTS
jgi:AcrR family transcriptional regulator